MMIELYDTTLRDGGQAEGVAFSVEDKLIIVEVLDSLGIHYIEGGYPGSNPKDIEFFKRVKAIDLQHAKVVPFGSTRHPRHRSDDDPNLLALLDTGAHTVTIFGKSWKLHATDVLRVTPEENLDLIESSVRFLIENGREVIYDAEHFFDGYADDPVYALQTLKAAAIGGARCLVLCDTNGGRLPMKIQEGVRTVMAEINLPVGIHAHNDAGMASANSVLAVQAGACHVQGTFNGLGERCGNANLASVIPTFKLKLGIDCVNDEQLRRLTEVSRLISELANLPHDQHLPYVGRSAFAHKGGVHIDAILKNRLTYEHIEPESVGNEQRILISDQAGRSAIVKKIEKAYPDYDKHSPEVIAVFERLKQAENEGYQYEGAEASFELLVRKIIEGWEPPFTLESMRVSGFGCPTHEAQPTCKLTVFVRMPDGNLSTSTSFGEGPVLAMDRALRNVLSDYYPELKNTKIIDHKIRNLTLRNGGTAGKVRVLLKATDRKRQWGAVGVSKNILTAYAQALVDVFLYAIEITNTPRSDERALTAA